jgi:uncharacterized protein DUF5135
MRQIEQPLSLGISSPTRTIAPVLIMAVLGVLFACLAAYLYASWIVSAQFKPADPGPDLLPHSEAVTLYALQGIGAAGCLIMLWIFAIRPKLHSGSFTTDGLLVIALPLAWWSDPLMNYRANFWVYNAYLLNMGSWAAHVPGWGAPYPDRFPEPLATGMAWLFWFFGVTLLGGAFLRRLRNIWPRIPAAALIASCVVFSFAFDLLAEMGSVRAGWYAIPGAERSISIDGGTRFQVPITEVVAAGLQTTAFVLMRYFRDRNSRVFAEKGADRLPISERSRTLVRFFAIYGAVNLIAALYFVSIQFEAAHAERWVGGLPSYMTTTCPHYKQSAGRCN